MYVRRRIAHVSLLSTTLDCSILDTASLALAVDALWEYVVTDFGETWLLLKLPR